MTDRTLERIKAEEGFRATMYVDTEGKQTIGYGCNLSAGWPEPLAALVAGWYLDRAREALTRALAWYPALDEVRKSVLDDMCFNMGLSKLMGFRNTLAAVSRGDYAAAADGMKASAWYGQVRSRATVLIKMMRTGEWP